MKINPLSNPSPGAKNAWQKLVAPYQHSDLSHSLAQLANSLLPYFGLWVLMVLSFQVSYWLTLLLVIPASLFLVRVFIIFHDCGHGSFFKSKRANQLVGSILGVLVFTPGEKWWHEHAIHHATAGNLDKRGVGDVMTLTVAEYLGKTPWQRFTYRVFRNPFVMFGIGPLASFFLAARFWSGKDDRRDRNSVIYTDLALLAIFLGMSWLIGWDKYILIQLPVMWVAGSIGIWLFYVQHQFETVYWVRDNEWSYADSAMKGASFYKLPGILNWFSGSIGFHHIHHLSPRIPNYNLQECYNENPDLQLVNMLTPRTALETLRLRLWDEGTGRLISLKEVKALYGSKAPAVPPVPGTPQPPIKLGKTSRI